MARVQAQTTELRLYTSEVIVAKFGCQCFWIKWKFGFYPKCGFVRCTSVENLGRAVASVLGHRGDKGGEDEEEADEGEPSRREETALSQTTDLRRYWRGRSIRQARSP